MSPILFCSSRVRIRHIITTLCAFLLLVFSAQLRSVLATFFIPYAPAGIVQVPTTPTVTLDSATVTGLTSASTNQFLGIPFAQPPIGNLRFQLPQALPSYNTSFLATKSGSACPQRNRSSRSKVGSVIPHFGEDCLTLNVVTPIDASPTSDLPVLVWIYGGAFQFGGTGFYNGSTIVEKAVSLGVPAIYVSMNYRLNAFGFLASQEVKDAGVGNLGLHDQHMALRWVQRYIRQFGGDPTKVTIWGESAGAMSVAFHMVTNGGNSDGLFRAAVMQSGSAVGLEDITRGQPFYDALVVATGCSGNTDTLQCLREVPYEILLDAVHQLPADQSTHLTWLPRVDGVFLKANPQYLVQNGSVANIPFISSNCDDEGTVFSLSSLNITTDEEFEKYIHKFFVPNASPAELKQLMLHYPSDPALGSPFDTGNENALTPQFKRIAAFQGDFTFQAPRRFFMQNLSGKQNIWSYVSKRGKFRSPIGAAHASDLAYVYGGGDIASYLLRFVTNLDPNVGDVTTDLYWPQYDAKFSPIMLEFLDGFIQQDLTTDTYRAEAIAYLIDLTLANPV